MLINEKEILARLNSPSNLISQIRSGFNKGDSRKNAMSLFTGNGDSKKVASPVETTLALETILEKKLIPNPFKKQDQPQKPSIFSPPSSYNPEKEIETSEASLDNLLSESNAEIKLALAHNSALSLMERAIRVIDAKIDNMKTSDLPKVVTAASRVVESIRKERLEINKQGKDSEVHFHFYTPQQKLISDYEVIDVDSTPAIG